MREQPDRQCYHAQARYNGKSSVCIPKWRLWKAVGLVICTDVIALDIHPALKDSGYGSTETKKSLIHNQDIASRLKSRHLRTGDGEEEETRCDLRNACGPFVKDLKQEKHLPPVSLGVAQI